MVRSVIERSIPMARPDLGTAVEISVTFVDNDEIQAMNLAHRGLDRPTDVLSFSLLEGEEMPAPPEGELLPLGDIVVNLERCAEQATEYGHSFDRELGFLVAHGMLHLMGFDHQTPAEEAAMMAKSEEILAELGLTR
jgi:probable rRNA maturation factor